MLANKYCITGMGIASPLGNHLGEYLGNLIKGESGISAINSYDTSTQNIKYAGLVKDLDFGDFMSKTTMRRSGRTSKLAIVASRQAYDDANLSKYPDTSIATIVASGMGETVKMLEYYDLMKDKGARRVAPFFSLFTNDLMAGYVSIELGLKAINYGVSCACASGSVAIMNAIGMLELFPDINAVIVCGAESLISKEILESLYQTKMLACQEKIDAKTIMKPYDKYANGFVVSEGAGAIVIERFNKHTVSSNMYAEIASFAYNSDSNSMIMEVENCDLKIKAINSALEYANITYMDVDYINGYGSSLNHVDKHELKAINECFYKKGNKPMISSTKSMLGHSFGASAILEVISTALTLKESVSIPNINIDELHEEYKDLLVINKSEEINFKCALKLSFASGNRNTAIVLKKI